MGIQADWVGKTPEEYAGKKEFTFTITMTGKISIYAKTKEQAVEIVNNMTNFDLLEHVEETKIE